MLEQLLPDGVAVVEAREDSPDAGIFAAEEELVAGAVEKRRREFATGRACARAALAQLGVGAQAILSGPRGEPRWPAGIAGSITHCEGFRACAVARKVELATIGIDAEVDAALPPGVLADVALPPERRQLQALSRQEPGVHWDRLLFSAKEAVYKAWFPLARRWLGFEDAIVSIDAEGHSFSSRLLVPGPRLGGRELLGFSGRWLAHDGLLLAAIALERVTAPQARGLAGASPAVNDGGEGR